MFDEEFLDEMSLPHKQADIKQTEIYTGAARLSKSVNSLAGVLWGIVGSEPVGLYWFGVVIMKIGGGGNECTFGEGGMQCPCGDEAQLAVEQQGENRVGKALQLLEECSTGLKELTT